jgi:hypothetical protein
MSKSKSKEQKDRIVRQIRRKFMDWWNSQPEKAPESHYCFWWAVFTVSVLQEYGHQAQLQAGSAFYKRIRPEEDDGEITSDWGYLFEWNEKARSAIIQGGMPEMHVWAAITHENKDGEIVDLTSKFFKERCEQDGYRWTNVDPPDYLWASTHNWPHNLAYYQPDMQAIALAYGMLQASIKGSHLLHIPIID